MEFISTLCDSGFSPPILSHLSDHFACAACVPRRPRRKTEQVYCSELAVDGKEIIPLSTSESCPKNEHVSLNGMAVLHLNDASDLNVSQVLRLIE